MTVEIAGHIVSLDVESISDSDVMALCAPYIVDATITQASISVSKEEYDRVLKDFTGYWRARNAFVMLSAEFYNWILTRGGFSLHSSAICYKGGAYLFTANSGTGKSTHARLWREAFGFDVRYINDDRPIISRKDGVWTAFGAPWCGMTDLGENISAPVKSVGYLVRDKVNSARRIYGMEAFSRLFSQTPRPREVADMDGLLESMEAFSNEVPIYELRVNQSVAAAIMANNVMVTGSENFSA